MGNETKLKLDNPENENSLDHSDDQNSTKNQKTSKLRRGGKGARGSLKHKANKLLNQSDESLVIMSANVAGLGGKENCLKSIIQQTKSNVIMLQETHKSSKGRIKVPEFTSFEAIRSEKSGGTVILVKTKFNPCLVTAYEETKELIVVQIQTKEFPIRLFSGYGPQENKSSLIREDFYVTLEHEIIKAKELNVEVIIAMDLNAKVGPELLPGDTNKQTANGKLLEQIITRQNLVLLNASDKTIGRITRARVTSSKSEYSTIDYVIASRNVEQKMANMLIDEERFINLARIYKSNDQVKVVSSDHNTILSKFHITPKIKSGKNVRKEAFNYKNIEAQKKFKEVTNTDPVYLDIANDTCDSETKVKKLLHKIKSSIRKSFKIVRFRNNQELKQETIKKWKVRAEYLRRNKTQNEDPQLIKQIEEDIANDEADDLATRIQETIEQVYEDKERLSSNKIWKLRKTTLSGNDETPNAVATGVGNEVTTNPEEIRKIALQNFKIRLSNNVPHEDSDKLLKINRKILELRLLETKRIVSSPWSMDNLNTVLKQLKPNKCKDPNEMPNEVFKEAGDNLKFAILTLMNEIKTRQDYPKSFKICRITAIYKNKGSRLDFSNFRGIFRVTILRSILDRLLYNDFADIVDCSLTDSNVGSRKGRNIRDNIMVLNAVVNAAVRGHSKPVDAQIVDIEKCFDKLSLTETSNALYDLGVKDDRLALIVEGGKQAEITIRTQVGDSDRMKLEDEIIMQGGIWGALQCVASMNKIAVWAYSNPQIMIKYRNKVSIPPLGMVDDLLILTECGRDTVTMNAVVNTFAENNQLTLAKQKTHHMHFGKRSTLCPTNLLVHDSVMESSQSEKYLGDIVQTDAKNLKMIKDRASKAQGKIAEIKAIISELPLGNAQFRVGLMLRQSLFMGAVLTNTEAWSNVTSENIKAFEKLDKQLLNVILKSSRTTPRAAVFLELGIVPVNFIIHQRRVNFWHTILRSNPNQVLFRTYQAQKKNPLTGDWTDLLNQSLKVLKMENIPEAFVMKLSKGQMKRFVKKQTTTEAFNHLTKVKNAGTKMKDINYAELKIRNYLSNKTVKPKSAQIIYNIRTGTTKIGSNYKKALKSDLCRMCNTCQETFEHIFECSEIDHTKDQGMNVDTGEIFRNDIRKQVEIAESFQDKLKQIEDKYGELLLQRKTNEPQLDSVLSDSTNVGTHSHSLHEIEACENEQGEESDDPRQITGG